MIIDRIRKLARFSFLSQRRAPSLQFDPAQILPIHSDPDYAPCAVSWYEIYGLKFALLFMLDSGFCAASEMPRTMVSSLPTNIATIDLIVQLSRHSSVAWDWSTPSKHLSAQPGRPLDASSKRPVLGSGDVALRLPWWQTFWAKVIATMTGAGILLVWGWRRRKHWHKFALQTERLKSYNQSLSSALWASRNSFWDWNLETDSVFLSGSEELLGPRREFKMTGAEWRGLVADPEHHDQAFSALEEYIAGNRDHYEAEYQINTMSGRKVWVIAQGRAVRRGQSGRALQIVGTLRNIDQERSLDRDRRLAQQIIGSMREIVCVTDPQFRIVSINPAFSLITGYTTEEVVGQSVVLLDSDRHSSEFYQQMRQSLEQNRHWSGEVWQRCKNGEQFLASLETNEVCDSNGQRLYWVAVLTDITNRKRTEQELRYLANYDPLTGLANRILLGERLAHSLIRARRLGNKVGVLFLDLDRFKQVNDSMGHAVGDRLLKAAAARVVAIVGESGIVARLGGDEFTVVLEEINGIVEVEEMACKLLAGFELPLEIDGRTEAVISTSIGISLYPEHGQVPTDLLKNADTAMYYAKDRGRNTYQLYTDAIDIQTRFRASIANQLHKALERGELSLVFQPKWSLLENRVTGVEALLRWNNMVLGEITPTTFIPIAEETGLIVPMGEWVLQQACAQIKRWNIVGLTETKIAVNVSALQLFRGELAVRLREILYHADVPAQRIEIELTESMLMANPEQSIATLSQIKALGVNIAIDDFGTGYSSLAYLKRLPIDMLKIDQTFITELSVDPHNEAITATIIMMAHSLGLDVIAEGVETVDQMRYLSEQRCDEVQGYLISQPLDRDRITQFLLDRRDRAAVQKLLSCS